MKSQVSKVEKRSVPGLSSTVLDLKEEDLKYVIGYAGFNLKKAERLYEVRISLDKASRRVVIQGFEGKVEEAYRFLNGVISEPKKNTLLEASVMAAFDDSYLVQPDNAKSGFLEKIDRKKILHVNARVSIRVKEVLRDKIRYVLAEEVRS